MKIKEVNISSFCTELIKPYKLSFVTLYEYRSNIVEVVLDNERRGIGEVTALPGYGAETFAEIEEVLRRYQVDLQGLDEVKARLLVEEVFPQFPFTASAISMALDFAFLNLDNRSMNNVPLVFPVSAGVDIENIINQVNSAFDTGYRTIKVKVGKDIEQDLNVADMLLNLPLDLSFRFDANQGYNSKEAHKFCNLLQGHENFCKVELLEQPFEMENWQDMEILCRGTSVPLMLDESIYDSDDIKRASEIGCSFIKLKFCKSLGFNYLLQLAQYAKGLGLKVVIGNGVSTDVTSFAEAVVYNDEPGLFYGASEGNGFVKLQKRVLKDRIMFENGCLIYSA